MEKEALQSRENDKRFKILIAIYLVIVSFLIFHLAILTDILPSFFYASITH